jgi:hypothetical protein
MSAFRLIAIMLVLYIVYLFYVDKIKKDPSRKSLSNQDVSFEFKVAGVSFFNDDGTSRQEILKRLQPDMPLSIIVDSQNRYDINALKVMSSLGCIGFVPKKEKTRVLSKLNETNCIFLKSKKQVSNGLWGCIVSLEFKKENGKRRIDSLSHQKSVQFESQRNQASMVGGGEKVKVDIRLLVEIDTGFLKIFSRDDDIVMHHYFFNEGKIISVELDQKDKNSVMVFVKFKHDTLSFSLKDLKQQFAKIVTLKASALPKYIVVKNAVAQNSTPFEDLVYPKKTVVPWLIERKKSDREKTTNYNRSFKLF